VNTIVNQQHVQQIYAMEMQKNPQDFVLSGNFDTPRVGYFPFVQRFHTPHYSIYHGLTKKQHSGQQFNPPHTGSGLEARRKLLPMLVEHAIYLMGNHHLTS
jgi:hypothetical protein